MLQPDERVECLVQGRFRGYSGVAALTTWRVAFVNDREWKPALVSVSLGAGVTVQLKRDDRGSGLVVEADGEQAAIDHIRDDELAGEMARRIGQRTGSGS